MHSERFCLRFLTDSHFVQNAKWALKSCSKFEGLLPGCRGGLQNFVTLVFNWFLQFVWQTLKKFNRNWTFIWLEILIYCKLFSLDDCSKYYKKKVTLFFYKEKSKMRLNKEYWKNKKRKVQHKVQVPNFIIQFIT